MQTTTIVTEGAGREAQVTRFLRDARVTYLHLHNAWRGCYASRVDRA